MQFSRRGGRETNINGIITLKINKLIVKTYLPQYTNKKNPKIYQLQADKIARMKTTCFSLMIDASCLWMDEVRIASLHYCFFIRSLQQIALKSFHLVYFYFKKLQSNTFTRRIPKISMDLGSLHNDNGRAYIARS